jgi:hypothetical protein
MFKSNVGVIFIDCSIHDRFMAKNKGDLILRDRLQFTLNATGNLAVNYGRIDLSDYVNVVRDEGLHIKEITYQLRRIGANTCVFNPVLADETVSFSNLNVFATTTAYEDAADVGIASPNVLNSFTMSTTRQGDPATGSFIWENQEHFRGVYDLHPEGYTVITDLLIGVAAQDANTYADNTVEIDIMIIAEPKKVTKDDLERMLAQATDL